MKFCFINVSRRISKTNIWHLINPVIPPLGLATLASVLENGGHEADIIDAAVLKLGIPEILERIPPQADIIALTSTTVEIENVISVVRAIRKYFRHAKILLGGVHPTIFHKDLVEEGHADMVVRGEGEDAVLGIARKLPLDTVPNLTWRTPYGKVISNSLESQFVNLDALPFPAYHKLPMNRYHSALGAVKRKPSIGMVTSRGCPGKCTFCFSGMFGSRIRFMSPKRVVEHIIYLKSNYGTKEISFYDDTFTANRERVRELCSLLIKEKIDITWSCFARVDTVEPALLKLMKEAGCHQIMYGFESSDENILKAMKKRINPRSNENVVRWTREAGIDVRGAFMLGNPGETEETMAGTIEYAKTLGIQIAIFNITTPYPGTAMFNWALEEGFLKHREWSFYDLAHPILELPSVSSSIVQKYYYKAYIAFYLRVNYIFARILSVCGSHYHYSSN
jgi:radical SAM superfamily enzyme YgiQ (UPF0313 family)